MMLFLSYGFTLENTILFGRNSSEKELLKANIFVANEAFLADRTMWFCNTVSLSPLENYSGAGDCCGTYFYSWETLFLLFNSVADIMSAQL